MRIPGHAQQCHLTRLQPMQLKQERLSNPLIAALLLTLKGQFEAIMGRGGDPAVAQVDIIELGKDPARAVAACRAAREVLDRKAPPALAAELRAWLYAVAEAAAHAAMEGGLFGLGGERVSAGEQAMLSDQ